MLTMPAKEDFLNIGIEKMSSIARHVEGMAIGIWPLIRATWWLILSAIIVTIYLKIDGYTKHRIFTFIITVIKSILWLLIGGAVLWGIWVLAGAMFYATFIGYPLGRACFRISVYSLTPFTKGLVPAINAGVSRKKSTLAYTIAWRILVGFWLLLATVIMGGIFYCTIIGIPFGRICRQLAKATWDPLGYRVFFKAYAESLIKTGGFKDMVETEASNGCQGLAESACKSWVTDMRKVSRKAQKEGYMMGMQMLASSEAGAKKRAAEKARIEAQATHGSVPVGGRSLLPKRSSPRGKKR